MIFLPNKFERYTAALRNYIHFAVLRNGLNDKKINMLRKISETEAIFFYNENTPINIKDFSNTLFITAYTKLLKNDNSFDFFVFSDKTFLINAKLFEILLLNLCHTSKKIVITCSKNKIIIESNSTSNVNYKILKALNAIYFYEIKTKRLIISITAEATDKKPLNINREWDILNPFSNVNIFLS